MEVKGEICYFTKKVINEFGKSQNIKVDKVELTDYFQRIKAVYWYEKLAEQGNATAQFNLGNSYKKGEGVEKDGKRAVELLENKSSSLLPPPAGQNVSICLARIENRRRNAYAPEEDTFKFSLGSLYYTIEEKQESMSSNIN